MKGKRIGVASAIDVYTYVAKEMIRKAGLDPDRDVEWVVGGGQNQRLTAILGGAIPGGLLHASVGFEARGAGLQHARVRPRLLFEPDPERERASNAIGPWRIPTCSAASSRHSPMR